jgi:hypothetical protein
MDDRHRMIPVAAVGCDEADAGPDAGPPMFDAGEYRPDVDAGS